MFPHETFGGLEYLSFLWDHGPIFAALAAFAIDFGIICCLMLIENIPPWKRDLYRAFLIGDSIFLPLYCGMVAVVLKDASVVHGFYTETWWHISWLAFFAGLSIVMEVLAVLNGQYTIWEELSPSKLYHTIIFPIVGYWIASTLIPVFMVASPHWAMGWLCFAIIGFIVSNLMDWQHGLKRWMHIDVRTLWDDNAD